MTRYGAVSWTGCVRSFCLAVVLALVANAPMFGLPAQAQAAPEPHSFFDFRKYRPAIEAIFRGDCQTAWDLMWPLARGEDHEAQHFLMEAVMKMAPPGSDLESRTDFLRHILVFGMNAALSDKLPGTTHPSLRDWPSQLFPFFLDLLALGEKGEQVAQCYKSQSTYQGCLNLAVTLGVVPSFSEYVKEIDDGAAKAGAAAQCRPDPRRRN